jgi:hypothetical protein
MAPKAEDEGGHMRVPAHCHVPAESERLRREVDARKRLDRGDRLSLSVILCARHTMRSRRNGDAEQEENGGRAGGRDGAIA